MQWLIKFFHTFPHVNFSFNVVNATFDLYDTEYLQSLAVWGCVPVLFLLVLVICVIVVWSIRCCCKRKREPKRWHHVKHLSNILFLLNIICCIFYGLCLYSNEKINRGLDAVSSSVSDLHKGAGSASTQLVALNRTFLVNVTLELEQLKDISVRVFREHRNDSLEGQVSRKFFNASIVSVNLADRFTVVSQMLEDFLFMNRTNDKFSYAEEERWSACLIVLCTFLAVLFLGLIGFCRWSKTISVLFSAAGLFVLVINWCIAALVLGTSVGIGDVCTDPEPFLVSQMRFNLSRHAVHYYLNCQNNAADELMPDIDNTVIRSILALQEDTRGVASILLELPSPKDQITQIVSHVNDAAVSGHQNWARMTASLSCDTAGVEVAAIRKGLCSDALFGGSLLLLGTMCAGIFLFITLMSVGKTWSLYQRRTTNDYVEVDEAERDLFLPQPPRPTAPNHSNTATIDFYGTHMMNPNTRAASTTGAVVTRTSQNGGGVETPTASTTPLWLRNSPPPARHANETRARQASRQHF